MNVDYSVYSLIPRRYCTDTRRFYLSTGSRSSSPCMQRDWLHAKCNDFIAKDEWPPNSPDLNPLDYHAWGVMLKDSTSWTISHKQLRSFKQDCNLQKIWNDLPQKPVARAVQNFRKRLQACVDRLADTLNILMQLILC